MSLLFVKCGVFHAYHVGVYKYLCICAIIVIVLKVIGTYLKPFLGFVFFACLFMFIQVVAELQLPNIMASIVDVGIRNQDMGYVISQGLIMLAWAVGSLACTVVASFCAARAGMGFGRDVRNATFTTVQGYSLFEFDMLGTSTLITRNTNDIQQLERFVQMLMTMAVMTPAMFIGAIIMAFATNAEMARIIFVVMPILIVLVLVFLKFGMPLLRSLQRKIDRLNRVMREGLQGVRVIRAYNKQEYEQDRFGEANRDLAETYVKVGRLMGGVLPLMMLIVNGTIIALYLFAAPLVDQAAITAGDIMALVQYVTMILMSLMMLSMLFAIMPRTLAAGERIKEVLTTVSSIPDEGTEEIAETGEGPEAPIVEMESVEHRFPGASHTTVNGITFSLAPGSTTVVIGPTGSGKTTLVRLMMRLYEATCGTVRFKGHDIREVPFKELRARISYTPQKAVLFTGSVAENMRFGAPDATDEQIVEALEAAQASEFVFSHEEGLDYKIVQGGENLSGGQRQRLCIARSLLREAELYVFDDCFSALDYRTDAVVRRAVRERLRGKTQFIVSQRVSTAIDADQVILLDRHGHIDAIGTHDELVATNESYALLAEQQLGDRQSPVTEGGEDDA